MFDVDSRRPWLAFAAALIGQSAARAVIVGSVLATARPIASISSPSASLCTRSGLVIHP